MQFEWLSDHFTDMSYHEADMTSIEAVLREEMMCLTKEIDHQKEEANHQMEEAGRQKQEPVRQIRKHDSARANQVRIHQDMRNDILEWIATMQAAVNKEQCISHSVCDY